MKAGKRKLILALAAVSLAVSAGTASSGPNHGNAPATASRIVAKASNVTFSNINLVTDVCGGVSGSLTVTATGTANDGGGLDTIWFTIFDDGNEKFAQQINLPQSTVATVINVSYPGTIGTINPGIGLEVGELRGDFDLADIDPFFPAQVGGCSAPGVVTAVPTLSQWMVAGLVGLVGLFGLGALRVRRRR
ncbi:MAG: hypothetical protein ABI881_08880 [Betaproteobacteria bacterium]